MIGLSDLTEVFKLFGEGFLIGIPLMGIFFLVGYVINFCMT